MYLLSPLFFSAITNLLLFNFYFRMNYFLQELRQQLLNKVYEVYDIFKDYFGEQFVDLQDIPSEESIRELYSVYYDGVAYRFNAPPAWSSANPAHIIVWWPSVVVTNEYDKSVVITDLYAKVPITMEGMFYSNGSFLLNRSSYSLAQYQSGYLHSHVPRISSNPESFQPPCLGTGPIKGTISSLRRKFDPTIWMLFCNELASYVTVESLTGMPYMHLEAIGGVEVLNNSFLANTDNRRIIDFNAFFSSYDLGSNAIQDFTLYYLKHGHLKFNFTDGAFSVGMPYYDFIIDISNCFIDYFNANFCGKVSPGQLRISKIIESKIVGNGVICNSSSSGPCSSSNIGKHVLYFKGRDIKLQVFQSPEEEVQTSTLLNSDIANGILQCILTILNFRYKTKPKNNGNTNNQPAPDSEAGNHSAPIAENVRYI